MGTMFGFIALVAISSHLAPYLTRRDIVFGVTVSRRFREGPMARKISRRYAIEVWLLPAAAAIVATAPMPFASGGMLLGLTIGASVAFAKAGHGGGDIAGWLDGIAQPLTFAARLLGLTPLPAASGRHDEDAK